MKENDKFLDMPKEKWVSTILVRHKTKLKNRKTDFKQFQNLILLPK